MTGGAKAFFRRWDPPFKSVSGKSKQKTDKRGRDAEKKTWRDPSADGLAAGLKPGAKDGRTPRLFFRRWDPPFKFVFCFYLLFDNVRDI